MDYDADFEDSLIDPDEARTAKRDDRRDRKAKSGIEAQREVIQLGSQYWEQLSAFGQSIGKLTPKDTGILQACSQMSVRPPSEAQCRAALAIADRLEKFYPQE